MVTQAQFRQAVALHQAGQLAKAQALYENIIHGQPNHYDALHLLGIVAYQTGNYGKAAELISRAIDLYPDNAAFHCNKGNALQALRQLDAAVASFDTAIELRPDFAEAYSNRGNAFKELNRLEAAVASFDRAVALKPDYAEAHFNRGNALQGLGQLDAAVASYDKAIALKPGYADAHYNRGNALQELEQLHAAVASYDKAIALKPDYAAVHLNRGNALQEFKQLEAAIASYDRAIALKPDYAEAHYNRGNALGKLKQPDAAVASYQKAIALQPDHALAHYGLGHVFVELGKPDAALFSYKACLAIHPDDRLGVRHLIANLDLSDLPATPSDAFLSKLYRERSRNWDETRVYRGHHLVAEMVSRLMGELAARDILDAGCGTGLVGAILKARSARIDGLDMSSDMLDKAREKGVYDRLHEGDLVTFMAQHPQHYDAVVSAATLIHFSDLSPVFQAATATLRDNGVFAFTVFPNEANSSRDVDLHPNFGLAKGGCFAHSEDFVRRTAQDAGFTIELLERAIHEHDEHGRPVTCLVVGLRKARPKDR